MGNVLSSNDNENSVIKKLYKLNKEKLILLNNHISKLKISNIEIGFINSLNNLNHSLKGKIPNNNFDNVNTFLNSLLDKNNGNPARNSSGNPARNSSGNPARNSSGNTARNSSGNPARNSSGNPSSVKSYSKQEVLKLFQLNNNFSEEELKLSFKKLAMIHHPDRPNGNNNKFQLITKLYLALQEEIKLKKEDKQFMDLKSNSQDYIKQQQSNNEKNYKLDRFEPQLFNKIFNETKIEDENNEGYSSWIDSNQLIDKDIEKNQNLDGNFNLTNFNTIFNKDTKISKELMEYKIPVALDSSNNLQHTKLGVKNTNYTTKDYSDFKEAHTTTRIIPTNVKREEFRDIHHLKTERSNIKKMTEEEIDQLNKYEILKKQEEENRLKNLTMNDNKHFENYHNIHHKMINNRLLR